MVARRVLLAGGAATLGLTACGVFPRITGGGPRDPRPSGPGVRVGELLGTLTDPFPRPDQPSWLGAYLDDRSLLAAQMSFAGFSSAAVSAVLGRSDGVAVAHAFGSCLGSDPRLERVGDLVVDTYTAPSPPAACESPQPTVAVSWVRWAELPDSCTILGSRFAGRRQLDMPPRRPSRVGRVLADADLPARDAVPNGPVFLESPGRVALAAAVPRFAQAAPGIHWAQVHDAGAEADPRLEVAERGIVAATSPKGSRHAPRWRVTVWELDQANLPNVFFLVGPDGEEHRVQTR